MPHLALTEYLFNLGQSALQCAIVFLILHRRLYKSFPAFTAYLIFAVIKTVFLHIELATGVSHSTYYYSYYATQPGVFALELWVVYEVFKAVLEPYEALRRSWRIIFLISVVTLVLVNMLWIVYEPKTRATSLAILDLMRSIRVLQVGLLVVIFALSRLMGLSWRSYCFGMALGLGINAATEIVTLEMRRFYDWPVWNVLNTIGSLSYAVSILIWAWYFFQLPEVALPVWVIPQHSIEKWNAVLQGMLARAARVFTRNRIESLHDA